MKLPFEHRIKKPFKYVPAASTNVALTIKLARKALDEAEAAEKASNVRAIPRNRKAA